ncbi:MAG: hypothetical protein WD225_03615 [Ilumatobacteraceae bacterium]
MIVLAALGAAGDDDVSIPWLSIVLVSVAIVALFVLARALMRPGGRPTATRTAVSPDDAVRSLGDAQWFHDRVSVDVLAGDAETGPARWAAQRHVVDGIVRDALRRGTQAPRSGWNELAASIAALQRALDTATAERGDASADPADVAESATEVDRAREQLRSQIDQVRRRV